jgi:hypothetical protein
MSKICLGPNLDDKGPAVHVNNNFLTTPKHTRCIELNSIEFITMNYPWARTLQFKEQKSIIIVVVINAKLGANH